jgi:hypothetical protein
LNILFKRLRIEIQSIKTATESCRMRRRNAHHSSQPNLRHGFVNSSRCCPKYVASRQLRMNAGMQKRRKNTAICKSVKNNELKLLKCEMTGMRLCDLFCRHLGCVSFVRLFQCLHDRTDEWFLPQSGSASMCLVHCSRRQSYAITHYGCCLPELFIHGSSITRSPPGSHSQDRMRLLSLSLIPN